jgi:hypothetical protein
MRRLLGAGGCPKSRCWWRVPSECQKNGFLTPHGKPDEEKLMKHMMMCQLELVHFQL